MFNRSYEIGSIIQRFLALLIDNLILGTFYFLLDTLHVDQTISLAVLTVVSILYLWLMWRYNGGQTVGHALFNLRVIKTDGRDLNHLDALLRIVGYVIGTLIFMLGFLTAVLDKDKQGWHDKIANTFVIKV